MRILVTGGAGFIGSHLVDRLLAEGHDVVVLDSFRSGKRENLAHVAARITLHEADVRDLAALERASEGCDVLFHEAAVVSVPYSVEHPQETHDVNIQGTLNALHAARTNRVRRVVFASSAAVYGEEPTLPKDESLLPAPIAPYGVEKLAGEHYLATFARLYGVETVALRYFNVFGPRQDPSSPYSGVISVFVKRLLADEEIVIYGDGKQSRDFIDVADVVEANLCAATAPAERVSGNVYNVARGERTSLLDLATLLGRGPRSARPPSLVPERPGDIRHSQARIDRARAELGFVPRVTLADGLARLVAHERALAP
ncbi:MAG: UDP-glucose 4-epimerase [Labilithrix sp.]|nr:UDP-glucose 4-epimerase [Labilithrix sp.]